MQKLLHVNYMNKGRASIDQYYLDIQTIWGRFFEERTAFDIFLNIINHSSQLAEAVRREKPKEVIISLAETVMWNLTFIAQLNFSKNRVDEPFKIKTAPSDIIWNKYPGICPACFDLKMLKLLRKHSGYEITKENVKALMEEHLEKIAIDVIRDAQQVEQNNSYQPCNCLSRAGETEARHTKFEEITEDLNTLRIFYAEATRDNKIQSIDKLGDMFNGIYGNLYQILSIENIAFHLLEEIGEISKALLDCYFNKNIVITSDPIRHLEEEIADLFSWAYALLLKIKSVYYMDAQEYFQTTLDAADFPFEIVLSIANRMSMSQVIWSKYGKKEDGIENCETLSCFDCHSVPCKCNIQMKIDWSKTLQYELNENQGFSIYYHADIDGIIAAAFFSIYLIENYKFDQNKMAYFPVDFNEKKTWHSKSFAKPFAVLDFLYHPDASFWFDHHSNPFISSEHRKEYEEKSKSSSEFFWSFDNQCASTLIYNRLLKKILHKLPVTRRKEIEIMCDWAAKIDFAKYATVDEWYSTKEPATKLNLILLYNRTPVLMNKFIAHIVNGGTFDSLMKEPDNIQLYNSARDMMEMEFEKFSKVVVRKNRVVFVDVTSRKDLKYHRFYSYKIYKDALFTVAIYNKADIYEISVGKNPWKKEKQDLNIGKLVELFNGGGQKDVGGVPVLEKKKALEISKKIISMLNSL